MIITLRRRNAFHLLEFLHVTAKRNRNVLPDEEEEEEDLLQQKEKETFFENLEKVESGVRGGAEPA